MIRQKIQEALKAVASEMGLSIDPSLEHPSDTSHGDYSSNIALIGAKTLKKNPMELAEEIKKRLYSIVIARSEATRQSGKDRHADARDDIRIVDRVEVAPPGFINFWLSQDYLIKNLQTVTHSTTERPVLSNELAGQKIMVEFADPNPFKAFHIGHLRNITLGESFARLLESQGATVWRVNYQGDVGMHVAKALYGLQQLTINTLQLTTIEEKPLHEKAKLLGEAYTLGAKAYEEDEKAQQEIRLLNIKVYKQSLRPDGLRNDPEIKKLWEEGKKWSLDHFEEMYKRVGTKYNRYYFESEVAVPGRQIVLDHIKDGIFERHEGAVVFRGEKHGLHTRVFVTKEDYATYEAKDMALAGIKYKDFPYERSIIITAHEQSPYFSVVLAAMKQVFPDLAGKTNHISFGFVRLKDTKMSSRLGNIITGFWLLDEAKERIKKEFSDMDEETAEKVSLGAVKYSMLKFSTPSDIAFSFEESISLEGNSGPYIQYSFARTQSVLAKATVNNLRSASAEGKLGLQLTINKKLEVEELALLRIIYRFPEVVSEASKQFAPNIVCNYLFELSQSFNLFYQKHKILNPHVIARSEATRQSKEDSRQTLGSQDDKGKDRHANARDDIHMFRLALTASIGHVLKNGLYLLGIEAPMRM